MAAAPLPTALVGRRAESSQIQALLARSRVVTVVGPGGMGKTRVARDVVGARAGAAWWVELADVVEPDLIVHSIAAAVGVDAGEPGRELDHLAAFLAARPGILTLDNCEHLVEAVGTVVSALVARCPGMSVLATSRAPLTIAHEVVYDLPPLSVPAPGQIVTRSTLARYDAATLFIERARTASATFEVTEENAPAIASLAAELDGLPLALELAAARVRMFSPEVILERIGERYRILRHGARDSPGRLRSLAASMAWSYDLCTPSEQALWTRLTVFVGGFDIPAAEQVCSGDVIGADEVLDLLGSLVDRSVVARSPEDPTRYRMLESIRQYGAARLSDDEARTWRSRHRDWCASLTEQTDARWIGPDQLSLLRRLRTEYPNIRAALDFATSAPETAPVALRMCCELEAFWICTGQLGEGRVWIQRALSHGTGSHAERALTLRVQSFFAGLQTDLTEARAALDAAQGHVAADGSEQVRGYHLFTDGVLSTWEGDLDPGLARMREGATLLHRSGHVRGHMQAISMLGLCQAVAGDPAGATESHHEGAAAAAPHGEAVSLPWVVWGLGVADTDSGNLLSAKERLNQALLGARDFDMGLLLAAAVEALAWVAAADGKAERAATLLGAADVLWERMTFPMRDSPFTEGRRTACDHRVRAELGPVRYEAAYRTGESLTLDQALDLALEVAPDGAVTVADPTSPLTNREAEIAGLVADGLSNREIAEHLIISERTVHGHMEKILQKLSFRSRVQVAAWVTERRTR